MGLGLLARDLLLRVLAATGHDTAIEQRAQ